MTQSFNAARPPLTGQAVVLGATLIAVTSSVIHPNWHYARTTAPPLGVIYSQGQMTLARKDPEEKVMYIVNTGVRSAKSGAIAQDGRNNLAVQAMQVLQEAMQGEAERAGLDTEEDVITFIRELRNA